MKPHRGNSTKKHLQGNILYRLLFLLPPPLVVLLHALWQAVQQELHGCGFMLISRVRRLSPSLNGLWMRIPLPPWQGLAEQPLWLVRHNLGSWQWGCRLLAEKQAHLPGYWLRHVARRTRLHIRCYLLAEQWVGCTGMHLVSLGDVSVHPDVPEKR